MNRLAPWLIISLTIALLAFICFPFGIMWPGKIDRIRIAVAPLDLIWILIFCRATIALRKRVIWLLIGAPFALSWVPTYINLARGILECHCAL